MKLTILSSLVLVLGLLCSAGARPMSEDGQSSADPSAKYEVYVPNGTGEMSRQMMSLPEIRSLLARQVEQVQPDALPTGSEPVVQVADVVSSVQTIMSGQVAQRSQKSIDLVDHDIVDVVPLSDPYEAQPEYLPVADADEQDVEEDDAVAEEEQAEQEAIFEEQFEEDGESLEEELTVAEPFNLLNEYARSIDGAGEIDEAAGEIVDDAESEEREARELIDDAEDEAEIGEVADEDEVERSDQSDDQEVVEEGDEVESRDDEGAEEEETLIDASARSMSYQSDLSEHEHHEDHHEHHEEHHEHHGDHHEHHDDHHEHHHDHSGPALAVFGPTPEGNEGLTATNKGQEKELDDLSSASNSLAWKVWNNAVKERSVESNEVFSPLALTTALGIAFLGSRGSTAEAIDETLGLDQLTSRNPHLHLQQVARDLAVKDYFSSVQSHVVYVNDSIGPVNDVFQARVNTLYGVDTASSEKGVRDNLKAAAQPIAKSKLAEALEKDDSDMLKSPFGIMSTAHLNVDWPSSAISDDGEDDSINFLNLPSGSQVSGRRLVSVPSIRANGSFYAGYDPIMDATAVALPLYPVQRGVQEQYFSFEPSSTTTNALEDAGHLSLVLVMPGSNGNFQAGGSGLAALEARLAKDKDGWNGLLEHTTRHHLHVAFPRLEKESHLDLSQALMAVEESKVDLAQLFDPKSADFGGITPVKNVHLAEIGQMVDLTINSVASEAEDDQARKLTKNQPAGVNKKSNANVKPTCSHAAVKKAAPKKPNNKATPAMMKASAAIPAVQKNQQKVNKKAPTKVAAQKNQGNAKRPISANARPAQKNKPGKKQAPVKVSNKQSQASKPKPSANKSKTQANKPKAPVNKPKTQAGKPKTPVKKQGAQASKPKTPANKPKNQPNKPKTPTNKPKSPVSKPKTPASNSKAPASKPKTQANKAQASANKPKNQASKPNTKVNKPKNQASKPNTKVNKPKNQANKPKVQANKPKVPVNKPKTPASKPKAPANNKPKTPANNKPKTPANKPKTPANKPKTPANNKPKTPANKPKTPANNKPKVSTNSKASANKSKVPVNKPKTPANRPVALAGKSKPKTPVTPSKAATNKPKVAVNNAKANKPKAAAKPAQSQALALIKMTSCKKNGTGAAQRQTPAKVKTAPVQKKAAANRPVVVRNKNKNQSHRHTREAPEFEPVEEEPLMEEMEQVSITEQEPRLLQDEEVTEDEVEDTESAEQRLLNEEEEEEGVEEFDDDEEAESRFLDEEDEEEVEDIDEDDDVERESRFLDEDEEEVEEIEEEIFERQSRQVDVDFKRIDFNRAFLYAVRHNPTGLLMMVGRYVHP